MFSTVMCLVLPMCFLSVLFCVMCVDDSGCDYGCESYVVLDQCGDPPLCLCSLTVRMVV